MIDNNHSYFFTRINNQNPSFGIRANQPTNKLQFYYYNTFCVEMKSLFILNFNCDVYCFLRTERLGFYYEIVSIVWRLILEWTLFDNIRFFLIWWMQGKPCKNYQYYLDFYYQKSPDTFIKSTITLFNNMVLLLVICIAWCSVIDLWSDRML